MRGYHKFGYSNSCLKFAEIQYSSQLANKGLINKPQ